MNGPSTNPFVPLAPGSDLFLPATSRFSEAGHLWSRLEIDALILAWAARRPLLVRGEAGSGKSQIARAAAAVLGSGEPLVEVIHPRFEALELLYKVDVVARLADAQVPGQLDSTNEQYVKPGCLWQAIERLDRDAATPVLLIDEIDKADADVPNALLDVLGNRSFTVPPLGDKTISAKDKRLPLVVITTNEERELPAAFVRRCVVLNLNPPDRKGDTIDADRKEAFLRWLLERAAVHRHLEVTPEARAKAAERVFDDRRAAVAAGYPSVGLAEFMDLLTALHELTQHVAEADRGDEQIKWLRRLGVYALRKHAGQEQTPAGETEETPRAASPPAPGAV